MTPVHVLVVEDNVVNQMVTMSILAQIGIQADLAKDGLEAITCFKEKSYDLVIMDCQMPRLDGWEATRAIRRLEASTGKHCPIIALTAQALAGDREKCLSAGMDDYLTKPVDAQLLERTVKGYLAGAPPAVSASAVPSIATPTTPGPVVILDAAIVQTIASFGPAGLSDVYGIMLVDLPQRRSQMALALGQKDAKTLGSVAHGLKGACGTVGAQALSLAAAHYERLGKAGDVITAEKNWPMMDDLFKQTLTAITDLLASRSGA